MQMWTLSMATVAPVDNAHCSGATSSKSRVAIPFGHPMWPAHVARICSGVRIMLALLSVGRTTGQHGQWPLSMATVAPVDTLLRPRRARPGQAGPGHVASPCGQNLLRCEDYARTVIGWPNHRPTWPVATVDGHCRSHWPLFSWPRASWPSWHASSAGHQNRKCRPRKCRPPEPEVSARAWRGFGSRARRALEGEHFAVPLRGCTLARLRDGVAGRGRATRAHATPRRPERSGEDAALGTHGRETLSENSVYRGVCECRGKIQAKYSCSVGLTPHLSGRSWK
jgi:hypothetical protein